MDLRIIMVRKDETGREESVARSYEEAGEQLARWAKTPITGAPDLAPSPLHSQGTTVVRSKAVKKTVKKGRRAA